MKKKEFDLSFSVLIVIKNKLKCSSFERFFILRPYEPTLRVVELPYG